MKTSTIILLAAVAVLLTTESLDARAADVDNDDDGELSEQQERMSLRSIGGENDDDDDSTELHERSLQKRSCVRCRLGLFRCCAPKVCIQKTLRMDQCVRIKGRK
jgi:hypothetical protein